MSLTGVVTSADLEKIAGSTAEHPHPRRLAGQLVAAVDEHRLADESDTGFALTIAALALADGGDLPGATDLVERARAANPADITAAVLHAQLLFERDREDDGMELLETLRPSLTINPMAAPLIGELLERVERAETAVQWFSEALPAALSQMREASPEEPDKHLAEDEEPGPFAIVMALAQERHRLREELDLPHDEYDELADMLRQASDNADRFGVQLFWPQADFTTVLERWPNLSEAFGSTWDEHRAQVERALVGFADEGKTDLGVIRGSVAGLVAYAERNDSDPADGDVVVDYAMEAGDEEGRFQLWPPERNARCWCGSGLKYKKCCLPRSRS